MRVFNRRKIMLVCYGGGHVKIMAPLYKKLSQSFDVSIIALTTARQYLKKNGIPYYSFSDFKELLGEDVVSAGKKLTAELGDEVLEIDESIAYLGLSFVELRQNLGSHDAAISALKRHGRSIFLPVKTMEYIISKLSPDLLVATNAPRAELAALIVARNHGIPSICINDNLWIEGGALEIARKALCDKLCVLSESVKQQLCERTNFPRDSIYVTGTPVFDELKNIRINSDKSRPKLKKKVILLADCELPEYNLRFPQSKGDPELGHLVRSKLNLLAKTCDWEVVFRPHPNQKVDYESFDNIRVSSADESLHELLEKVDVVVTAISTVGIEGKMLRCGLVSIEGTVYEAAGSYESLGLSTGVRDAESLELAIRKELNSSEVSDFELYPGWATESIAHLAIELLK